MTATVSERPAKSAARRTKQPQPLLPSGVSLQARRQAAAILEVLAGLRRPSEAAHALGTSLPRYYQLERRALQGMVQSCEPAPRGPRLNPSRQIAALERENRRLQRECDRQQALVRGVQRSLGLAPVMPAKPPGKGQDGKTATAGDKKRQRKRRPSVRALKAIQGLQVEDVTAAASPDASAALSKIGV